MNDPLNLKFNFQPPALGKDGVSVEFAYLSPCDDSDDPMYDLFDDATGECLNEGCPFVEPLTEAEAREWIETGSVKGKYE